MTPKESDQKQDVKILLKPYDTVLPLKTHHHDMYIFLLIFTLYAIFFFNNICSIIYLLICICVYISYVFIYMCLVAQSCPTLCDSMDCSRLFPPWGFFRQVYWSGLPYPPPRDLPNPGLNPDLPHCRQIFYPSEPPGGLFIYICMYEYVYSHYVHICVCTYTQTYIFLSIYIQLIFKNRKQWPVSSLGLTYM